MKKFVVREVETLRTTASGYGCWCQGIDGEWVWICEGLPTEPPPSIFS